MDRIAAAKINTITHFDIIFTNPQTILALKA
jgi:hypothetical protein